MKSATRFDAEYYRRFYGNKQTAVTNQVDMSRRAGLIGAFLRYVDLPVRSILDAGCGIGLMTEPLKEQFPKARYTGLEASE
jgi:trans-aconitate methyltransferase